MPMRGEAPPHDGSILQPTAKPRTDKRLRRRHRVNRIALCSQSSHCSFLDRIYRIYKIKTSIHLP